MKMLETLKGLFKRRSRIQHPQHPSDEWVAMFAKMLQDTRHEELSCDDVFQIIDQYADLLNQGENAETLMPLIRHHLVICLACNEEFEALMRILQGTTVT